MKNNSGKTTLPDLDLRLLSVKDDDALTNKMLMLIEGIFGLGVKHSIIKYGYTEQRYYQLLKDFQKSGSDALIDQKRGPKKNSRRSEKIIQQIIRQRFLDSDASAAVIAQKLNQTEMPVSIRSVERTIQEYGLQKKTSPVKSGQ
jgi:transposase